MVFRRLGQKCRDCLEPYVIRIVLYQIFDYVAVDIIKGSLGSNNE
jgi:hypothetical protein